MKAVLITGNPKYINNERARTYYASIIQFLNANGVDVAVDPGAEMTCPPKADFYVAHSRGCDRVRCVEGTPSERNFLMFGDLQGYIHPVDAEWQRNNKPNGGYNPPPDEHFEFTSEQQNAILRVIASLTPASTVTRQDPGRGRPKPRG